MACLVHDKGSFVNPADLVLFLLGHSVGCLAVNLKVEPPDYSHLVEYMVFRVKKQQENPPSNCCLGPVNTSVQVRKEEHSCNW